MSERSDKATNHMRFRLKLNVEISVCHFNNPSATNWFNNGILKPECQNGKFRQQECVQRKKLLKDQVHHY